MFVTQKKNWFKNYFNISFRWWENQQSVDLFPIKWFIENFQITLNKLGFHCTKASLKSLAKPKQDPFSSAFGVMLKVSNLKNRSQSDTWLVIAICYVWADTIEWWGRWLGSFNGYLSTLIFVSSKSTPSSKIHTLAFSIFNLKNLRVCIRKMFLEEIGWPLENQFESKFILLFFCFKLRLGNFLWKRKA